MRCRRESVRAEDGVAAAGRLEYERRERREGGEALRETGQQVSSSLRKRGECIESGVPERESRRISQSSSVVVASRRRVAAALPPCEPASFHPCQYED